MMKPEELKLPQCTDHSPVFNKEIQISNKRSHKIQIYI